MNLMAFFTERMEAINHDILRSRSDREAAVTRLKEETAQILTDGRTLLKQIGDQTRAQAVQCRKHLAHDRRALAKHVHALREKNSRDLHRSAKQLRHMLDVNCTARQTYVRELRQGFIQFQKALAADLHEAGRHWRESNHRHTTVDGTHGHRHSGKAAHAESGHKKGHSA
jgi:hypothetical protein